MSYQCREELILHLYHHSLFFPYIILQQPLPSTKLIHHGTILGVDCAYISISSSQPPLNMLPKSGPLMLKSRQVVGSLRVMQRLGDPMSRNIWGYPMLRLQQEFYDLPLQ
jgi:hypothetical protein